MKEIQLNPQQLEAVSHRDGPMIVLSVAGSGKTMVLIERIEPSHADRFGNEVDDFLVLLALDLDKYAG